MNKENQNTKTLELLSKQVYLAIIIGSIEDKEYYKDNAKEIVEQILFDITGDGINEKITYWGDRL